MLCYDVLWCVMLCYDVLRCVIMCYAVPNGNPVVIHDG